MSEREVMIMQDYAKKKLGYDNDNETERFFQGTIYGFWGGLLVWCVIGIIVKVI